MQTRQWNEMIIGLKLAQWPYWKSTSREVESKWIVTERFFGLFMVKSVNAKRNWRHITTAE